MNSNFYSEITSKRVKERNIGDAYNKVQQWRYFYRNGIQENGNSKKINLKEAAHLVQIPKKTLEDYIQIFNKVELLINIEEITDKKMGYLRTFMKKNKSKIKKAMSVYKQQQREQKQQQKQKQKVKVYTEENNIEDGQTDKNDFNLSENYEVENDIYYENQDLEDSLLFFNRPLKNPNFD